jgi:uncharacterized protein YecT (DUF1311 family)
LPVSLLAVEWSATNVEICEETHMKLRTAMLVLAFASSHAAAAGPEPICAASKACDAMSSNIEIKACLAQLAKDQDSKMNTLYQKVRALLRDDFDTVDTSAPKIWPQVLAAQRAWITFRDAQCMGEASIAQGGTAGGGWYSDCVCRLTAQRNKNLGFILKNFGAN